MSISDVLFGAHPRPRIRLGKNRIISSAQSRSRSESLGVGINWSPLQSVGVNRKWSWSKPTGAVRCNWVLIRHFISLCFISGRLRTTPTTPNDSKRIRTTPDDPTYQRLQTTPNDSARLRTTPDVSDSERLRTIPDFSGRFRTTLGNAGRTYLLESVPEFLPTLPITSVDYFIS